MIPVVSTALSAARAIRGLSMTEVASRTGVQIDDVFKAENFLDAADTVSV